MTSQAPHCHGPGVYNDGKKRDRDDEEEPSLSSLQPWGVQWW